MKITWQILTEPFPLRYEVCDGQPDLSSFVRNVLTGFGGVRRANTIGKEMAVNLAYLQAGGWEPTFAHLDEVRLNSSPQTERKAAEFVDSHLRGSGPKQSRNLLQWLTNRTDVASSTRSARATFSPSLCPAIGSGL